MYHDVTESILQGKHYLTDGGLETTLIYHEGIDLPHFAAFELLNHSEGREAFRKYYLPYLRLAEKMDLNFILETPTWRANPDWGFKLGYSQEDLDLINREAVKFMRELKQEVSTGMKVLISGNIGPRGDGYVPANEMNHEEAEHYHQSQINSFAAENLDLVTALTINYTNEAIGIVQAARAAEVPVVISFTVETNGLLPNGNSLHAAIDKTDQMTGAYASHYLINCAHPQHFREVLLQEGEWKHRIKGVRANASIKSHAELDNSEVLDTGDKKLLAAGYHELKQLLPNLQIIGGCCGTDHSHLEQICEVLFTESPSLES